MFLRAVSGHLVAGRDAVLPGDGAPPLPRLHGGGGVREDLQPPPRPGHREHVRRAAGPHRQDAGQGSSLQNQSGAGEDAKISLQTLKLITIY